MNKTTPAMQQYYDLKSQYTDCILFFRMWDFYEMFWNDAELAHDILGISITSRNKNASEPIALAWIPYHAKDKYLPLLLKAWHKVAIAEQISDSNLKWIVKREVVRVVSEATLNLEWSDYSSDKNLYIASIVEKSGKYGLSYLESNKNIWFTGQCNSLEHLVNELYKLQVQEIVITKDLFGKLEFRNYLQSKLQNSVSCFDQPKRSYEYLCKHFNSHNLKSYWIEENELCIFASALLLSYISFNQKSNFSQLESLAFSRFDDALELDESTIKNLDILYNYSTGSYKEWTLRSVVDKTKTQMWKRTMQENLLKPFKDLDKIHKRQEIIWCFVNEQALLIDIQKELSKVSDIDAIVARMQLDRYSVADLLKLKQSLEALGLCKKMILEHGNKKLIKLLNIE